MNNIEFEYKIIITHDMYQTLQKHLQKLYSFQTYVQNNTYFDDENNTLKNNDCALRIRFKNNLLEWTYKQKLSKHKKIELKQIVPKMDWSLINSEIKVHLNNLNFNFNTIKTLCNIETKRTDFNFYHSTLSLDENLFNNKIKDYELEFEIQNNADIIYFKNLIREFDIEFVNANSKVARAIKYENT